MEHNSDRPQKITLWRILVLFLSIYSILAISYETLLRPPDEIKSILNTFDYLVCAIFLGDFFVRFSQASSKLSFMKWGWIDLISSIPTIDALRWGRLFRVIRILRGAKSLKMLILLLYQNRAKGMLLTSILLGFTVILAGSIAILQFESSYPGSNIKSAEDALWWTIVTITTVGYGDYYPITSIGRFIAIILMVTGIGMFGTFTAYVASFFAESEDIEDKQRDIEILEAIDKLHQRLDEIENSKNAN